MKHYLGNVFILGDSYSTFQGYIPDEHKSYYGIEGFAETDVSRVNQTWWHLVIQETESHLVLNHSWSGTTICNTGYDGPDIPHSFIRRFDKLAEKGFFLKSKIDTVFVMGGQNDDWCNAPIGELKISDWTDEDLLQYGPALCYLMYRLKIVLPTARILFVVNSEMKELIMDYQVRAAEIYDVECIQLEAIHKMNCHPTIFGMKQIADQILDYLNGGTERK